MILVLFSDFFLLEIMKTKIFIMKKKNLVQKTWVGLLPNCIARAGGIVL